VSECALNGGLTSRHPSDPSGPSVGENKRITAWSIVLALHAVAIKERWGEKATEEIS
jgi:hypothetical protein